MYMQSMKLSGSVSRLCTACETKSRKSVKITSVKKKMVEKYVREESMIRGPKFLVRIRSHTVYENTSVKLFCTVEGFPLPVVKWCSTDDTAQYTVVASNVHGQASSQASVIVKSKTISDCCVSLSVNLLTVLFLSLSLSAAMLPQIHYTKIHITFLEKFGPVFASEGGSVSLTATMTLNPNLANLQPEAQWYRDDTRLSDSKWVKIETGRGVTTLTLPHLYKDDEGLYTLRMVTKGGIAEHSAFVSVADGPPPVPGAPGAPMDIKIHDANRDYVIVSWKPPNTTTEGPILGYFVDKCEVGTENWTQCNDHPIKICKYPVSGLFEGHSYYFRVRAVNSHGISKPSRMSDPIAALDPTEFERLHAKKLGGKLDVVSYHDDLEAEGKPPGAPSGMYASETDRTYVVLSWKAPAYSSRAPMWYYIEKSMAGSGAWQRINTQVPVRSPRYAAFDLAEGKEYQFRVLSANMYGTSEPSEPTGPIQTEELKGVPSAPGQVISTRETDTSVLIQWAPPKEPNNLIGYYIDQCVKGSKDWTSANHKPHKSTKFVVSGLTTGETYIFRVQAINELGLSDESQESAPLSVKAALKPPSAPYTIALLNCDGHSMVLNWQKPLHSGGAKIKEYYVDKRRAGTTMWREINIPPLTERGLTEGAVYQFQVYAANIAGLGPASRHSADYTCEAWNMPEPGPAYDLTFCEVRDDSLVVEWQKPHYTGSGPITGYQVEYAKQGTSNWITANETAVSHRFLKVTSLEVGTNYVFRVRAVNAAGTGMASMSSDAVVAKAVPGAQEMSCEVEQKTGDIVFSFESCQMSEESHFVWKKNYKEITDFSKGIVIKTEGSHTKLIFKNADKEDFGTYSVSVTNTDGVISSSHLILLCFSPLLSSPLVIPLKSELSYKILERGRMRFWLQAEEISSNVTYKFFANDKELSGAPNHMGHDVSTGVIEFIMDHFTEENEGTFTCQITDGGGKAQSSLVLIGNGKRLCGLLFKCEHTLACPHFSEFLSVQVGDDCSVTLVCKAAQNKLVNWMAAANGLINSGQKKKKEKKKEYTMLTSHKGCIINRSIRKNVYLSMISNLGSPPPGSSAADLVISCTATGIQLQCHMKYYTSEMNITWLHGDKGMYSIIITDLENSYKRTLELSGDVNESLRPRCVCCLPLQTLSLTCTVCGDPRPQVSWLKNGADVEHAISLDQGKFASLTIKGVSMDDSGRYTMIVQNKYGGESVDIVVSVYRHGEKIPEAKPTLTPKTIIPPKLPIEMPQPKTAPSPAPSSPSPAPPKSPAPGRGVKSPTPTRRK
uniref:Myomesin 2 n=1 Tax=Myripristis murdjan TaxID=586833 RepID=A0A668AQ48_9TELE